MRLTRNIVNISDTKNLIINFRLSLLKIKIKNRKSSINEFSTFLIYYQEI